MTLIFFCELSPIGFLDIFKQCDLQRDVSNPKSLVTLSLLFSCQVFSERSETTSRKVDTFFNGLSLHWTIFFQASSSSSSILKKVTKQHSFLRRKILSLLCGFGCALASSTLSGKFSRQ